MRVLDKALCSGNLEILLLEQTHLPVESDYPFPQIRLSSYVGIRVHMREEQASTHHIVAVNGKLDITKPWKTVDLGWGPLTVQL